MTPHVVQPRCQLRRAVVAAALGSMSVAPTAAIAQDASRPAAEVSQTTPALTVRPALLPEPRLLRRAIDLVNRRASDGDGEIRSGFYPEFSNMASGGGWISAGPGYRQRLAGGRLFFETSAAVSWRLAKMAQFRIEAPQLGHARLTIGAQAKWQDMTQLTFFGEGPDADVLDRSEYRLRTTNAVGYATVHVRRWLDLHARGGWLSRPQVGPPAGTFQRGYPATGEIFAADPVFALAEQPSFLHGELAVVADNRDSAGHPTRGGIYRGSWAHYADRAGGFFGFSRYEAEGAQFMPVADGRVVLAVHGWLVGTASDGHVPFYLLPNLGGSSALRGFANHRYHDRSLALVNVESRVAMFEHLDVALFADAGSVAPRLGDLDVSRRSYGVGVRVHSGRATLVRVDVGRSREGWRFLFSTADPFRFKKATARLAAVPF